jgi:hypothetical protein
VKPPNFATTITPGGNLDAASAINAFSLSSLRLAIQNRVNQKLLGRAHSNMLPNFPVNLNLRQPHSTEHR